MASSREFLQVSLEKDISTWLEFCLKWLEPLQNVMTNGISAFWRWFLSFYDLDLAEKKLIAAEEKTAAALRAIHDLSYFRLFS